MCVCVDRERDATNLGQAIKYSLPVDASVILRSDIEILPLQATLANGSPDRVFVCVDCGCEGLDG